MEWKKHKNSTEDPETLSSLYILITVPMKVLLHKWFYFESMLEIT